ncbi:MAG TPA: hypothetical protein VMT46_10700 [Anaerolineaceae bacterium]|nr:hypothetical protein [Anaerolineaceae bacterium]
MNANTNQKVTAVNTEIHAITVQNALENAGIPVTLAASRNGDYLDVLVPRECVYDARNLLDPERRSGEIFCVPGRR